MNLRKGIVRTLLAFGLPWTLFWGWTYWEAAKTETATAKTRSEWIEKAENLSGADFRYALEQEDSAYYVETEAAQKKEQAIQIGMELPAALTINLAGLFWVFRGFRSGGPNK